MRGSYVHRNRCPGRRCPRQLLFPATAQKRACRGNRWRCADRGQCTGGHTRTDGSSQLRVFIQNLFLLSTSSVTVGRQSRDESTERTLAKLESVESQFESIRLRIPVRTGLSDAFMGNGIMPVLFGWEGNRRSDVALAIRHRRCGISLYPTAG